MDEMLMKGESVGFLKKGKAVAEMSCAFQRVVLFYFLTSLCLGRLCTIYMASFETSPPFTFFSGSIIFIVFAHFFSAQACSFADPLVPSPLDNGRRGRQRR